MKYRISKKQGRHRRGIGGRQLDNVRSAQQERELVRKLHARGYTDADIKRMVKEHES